MNTNQLVSDAKVRFKHLESKLYLHEKYTSLLNFTAQNGNWTASIELISFLRNSNDKVILLDNFKNPVKVDSKLLLDQTENLYNKVMEEYLSEFTKLQGNR